MPIRASKLRHAAHAAIVLATIVAAAPLPAGEPGGLLQTLTAPVRALHRKKPATCPDDTVERLAAEVDWLEAHLRAHGSIVAKQPDIWGQNRLTRARHEYEEQLRAQLTAFQELNNASLRRSDQAFLGLALALGQSPTTTGRAASTRPADATASVTNLISNPVGGGTAGEAVIARTAPFAAGGPAFAGFGLDAGNAVSLEPTIHLDHLSRYLNHLHELRRINEGDDITDSPGYALNLVRIPVSVNPGQRTQTGHGACITITADPQLGDDLLPTTFRNLVVNDLVDMLAPSLTFAVNASAVRAAIQNRPAAADADPVAAARADWSAAALQRMRSRSVSVPTAKMRRARMPLPPEQLVDVLGTRQVILLLESTHEALATHPANMPCIKYADVRGFLGEELLAAQEFLAQERQRQVWAELPGWNLAELVRSRRANELELRRRAFFTALGFDSPGFDAAGFAAAPATDAIPDALPDDAPPEILPPEAAPCMAPCANPLHPCRICRTTTAVLAWAILVESALLNDRLAADMLDCGPATGHATSPADSCAGPFYGPDPAPEARAAFNDYVRRRWPIRVFALDPVSQEQNVEEQSAQRREMQVAMAMAFASGRANSQALARYARRLETDLATIALNKTAVGFTHGADTFGWRFYPRIQPPAARGNLATLTDTICGTSPTARDLASRRLEPGMRECTALVVMPSFVPRVSFDVRTNWFSLTHPAATEQTMRQAMLLSRSVTAMQQRAGHCQRTGGYRGGDTALLVRRIEQLDRELPLQSMLAQIPHENTAGGFELFNSGITDLAPELIGWYGAHGVDPAGTTVLFLVGKGFSVHDTSVVAGGRPVKTTLLGRQLLRAEIPPGVQTILPAGDCDRGSGGGSPDPLAARRRRHPEAIRLTSSAEPLPAPTAPAAPPTPGSAAATGGNQSLRLSLPPVDGIAPPAPGPDAAHAAESCGCGTDYQGLGPDCHTSELVDVHLATPYGVSGHLLIPVVGTAGRGADRCGLSFTAGTTLRLTASRTKAGTWRVNEFFASTPDTIRITVPAVFSPPSKATVTFLLRDPATGGTAGTFSIPAPPFDPRSEAYVLAGADLRNFVGDTSRPATDKTLRGALKPYLDSLGTGGMPDGTSGANRELSLTAELVTDQKTIPITGAIAVTVRENNQPADQAEPPPPTAE